VPGAELIRAVVQVHRRQHRVKGAADLEQAQHLFHKARQIFRIGETAVHVGDELEFAESLGRILAQTFAGEILNPLGAEARRLLLPLVRAPIFDGNRHGARLRAGAGALRSRRIAGRVVLEDRLPFARADVEPAVRAAEPAERRAKISGENLRVRRQAAVGGVTPGAAPAIDFFLLGELLVEPRRRKLLGKPGFHAERLRNQDDPQRQARRRAMPRFIFRFDRAHGDPFLPANRRSARYSARAAGSRARREPAQRASASDFFASHRDSWIQLPELRSTRAAPTAPPRICRAVGALAPRAAPRLKLSALWRTLGRVRGLFRTHPSFQPMRRDEVLESLRDLSRPIFAVPAQLIALAAALSYAISGIAAKRGLRYSTPITVTLVSVAIHAAALWIALLIFRGVPALPGYVLFLFVLSGLIQPVLRFLTYAGIHYVGAAAGTTLRGSHPLFSTALAILFLGEALNPPIVLGTMAIVAGVALIS